MAVFVKYFFLFPAVFSFQNKTLTNNYKTLKSVFIFILHWSTFSKKKRKEKKNTLENILTNIAIFVDFFVR
jgi:hypothetical protein